MHHIICSPAMGVSRHVHSKYSGSMLERGMSEGGEEDCGTSGRGTALPSTGLPLALSNEGGSESWDGDKGHQFITEGAQNHMHSGLLLNTINCSQHEPNLVPTHLILYRN